MILDEENEINTNIRKFIKKNFLISEENLIFEKERIEGMTNKNFHVKFYDKTVPDKKYEILYKKYGNILDLSDHRLELCIIDYYSKQNEGPKALFTAENYRIEEYIKSPKIIPLELRYNNIILGQIYHILANYTLISNVYKYSISPDLQIESFIKYDKEEKTEFYPIFQHYEKMLKKSKEKYNIFITKFNEYFSKNQIDEKLKKIKDKYDYYIQNQRKIFMSLFPRKGFFVLCHNDCQRWNFIYRDLNKKLSYIDHEYACYCLPGLDLCNYMNENSFYFYDDGSYEFKKNEIDFDFYYDCYKKYVEEFFKTNQEWINREENKEFAELIKTRNYYILLHSINNMFWFLFCVFHLDFEKEIIKKTGHFFEYGYDRLCYAELAQNSIK